VKRFFNWRQRYILALLSGGRCQISGVGLNKGFHADHMRPFSQGGLTTASNGQALCPKCNATKGAKMTKLRPWQEQALAQALQWLTVKKTDRHFLINAAPGAGKTIAACAIAASLFEQDEIDRVIVIAPRTEVVNQWAIDFQLVTSRYMVKVTGGDGDVGQLGIDLASTWAAVEGLSDALQALCKDSRVLLICDEHHHAAVRAAWGGGAESAFAEAKYVLILTGTPMRSDGNQAIWLAYDDEGAIDHPAEGTYTLSYGEAVDLGYCRPVTFHRHEGRFTVDLEEGEGISVSSKEPANLSPELRRIAGLQAALNFYRLACTPQFKADGKTPLLDGYQASMLEWASQKLTDLRNRMPEAGGLVIAPSIEVANYFAALIKLVEGDEPMVVHSKTSSPDNKIAAFRRTDKRWLVSVAMVSEGVDIKRLRVLIYLPNALTELAFRQAIGRVVRTSGPHDNTRAYVVMPSFETLEVYARRVEDEMSLPARKDVGPSKTKKCPDCTAENPLDAKTCSFCGYEFPARPTKFKTCDACQSLNPLGATECQSCGKSFSATFVLSLEEALRTGAIVRGMDIDEDDVQKGEALAEGTRRKVLESGDAKLVKFIQTFPEETWARLKSILNSDDD